MNWSDPCLMCEHKFLPDEMRSYIVCGNDLDHFPRLYICIQCNMWLTDGDCENIATGFIKPFIKLV